jgi:two-component system chemotaxis response regulator CheB
VLVVDDSHFVRRALVRLLGSDPRIQVVSAAASGADAVDEAVRLVPDVVTLDVEMPGMDGLATLDALMRRRPTPVVMVSAHTAEGAQVTLRALARGAVDFVAKPGGAVSMDLGTLRDELIAKVLAAARAHAHAGRPVRRSSARNPARVAPGGDDSPARPEPSPRSCCVAIGSSTGGVMALQAALGGLPQRPGAPIVVAQHMPALFTGPLAELLREATGLPAREARDGEMLAPDTIYVAPGGFHTTVAREAGRRGPVRLRVSPEPAQIALRPSVNQLFTSVARVYGPGTVAVILTGMGNDGTEGLRAVKAGGGVTLAQDESTSVVYGMPGSAVRAGLADVVAPVGRMGEEIVRALGASVRRDDGRTDAVRGRAPLER